MMPAGPLMIEHRLIEKAIKVMGEKSKCFSDAKKADVLFIDKAVDFIRVYADKCHHGKEENILFRELAKKPLQPGHKKIMDELVQEHVRARGMVKDLAAAREKYASGNTAELSRIVELMSEISRFYPPHIEKEDKCFFIPCMKYFSKEELDVMLQKFWDFDKKLIHEKYQAILVELEGSIS